MEGSPYLFLRGRFCVPKSSFKALQEVESGQFRITWDGGDALLSAEEARRVEDQLLGGGGTVEPPQRHPAPRFVKHTQRRPEDEIARAM